MRKLRDWAGPLVVLGLFVLALFFLHKELKHYRLKDLRAGLAAIPRGRLLLATGLTLVNYLIFVGYDRLGLAYIRHPLRLTRVAFASLLGYAIGNNMGTLLGGSTVRLRLYTAWGVSAVEVVRMVLFLSVTFWVGLFTLGGAAFMLEPLPVPKQLHLPITTSFPLGVLISLLVAAYLASCAVRRKPLQLWKWSFELPRLPLATAQIGIAALDQLVASSVLFVLLPASLEVSFVHFVAIYLLAVLAGFISGVPGGLGVLELVVILLLSPNEPHLVLGALFAYRAIYYLIPLCLGLLVLGGNELLLHRRPLTKAAQSAGRLLPLVAPRELAVMVFLGGAMLLISGTLPVTDARLALLVKLLPLPVVEFSHFMGSVLGVLLLVLARGLQRRVETAYYGACALLAGGIVVSLLKGLNYKEAVILGVMLALLVPCRSYFYRRGALLTQRFSLRWFVAVGIVLACTVWLTFFAYKHVEYSNELWWQFTFQGNAPRALRALVGAAMALLAVMTWRLTRGHVHPPGMPTREDIEAARAIVAESPQTNAQLALLGDKRLLFNADRTALVMYGVEGRSWVAMGDAVGPPEAARDLAWEFYEMCDQGDRWPVFYQVDEAHTPLYVEMGLSLIKIGESARVPLADFSLEGSTRRHLRHTVSQLSEAGCTFEVLEPPQEEALLAELKTISDDWLAAKSTAEKGFSLGFFEEDYLRGCPVALVRQAGKIVAFANVWQGAGKQELSLDLMRYASGAPDGTMEYLFAQVMLWGSQRGYAWFDLGMAPLAGMEGAAEAPLWSKAATLAYRYGEHFYNFQGLRQYKEKFHPVWETKYLASPGGLALPRILSNVATLISGGLRGLVSKQK